MDKFMRRTDVVAHAASLAFEILIERICGQFMLVFGDYRALREWIPLFNTHHIVALDRGKISETT
ncbi:hypothetical protein DB032_04475 [Chromobacterium sp. Panama]|nr:hypothetical protein DB032_04475 [Chromobacterium sp. Panama]